MEAGSPEAWRDALTKELMRRRERVLTLEAYYQGEHPLPGPPKRLNPSAFDEARKAYASLMRMGVTNWVKLVADAPAERLEVVGFRLSADTGSTGADNAGWQLWQQFDMDEQSPLVHDNALQTGQAFVMVDPFSGEITAEHSGQMIVAYQPGSRRTLAAALKMWQEDDDAWMVTLILPDAVHKWQGKSFSGPWMPRAESMTPNPRGYVPVVEFAANPTLRPRLYGGGTGEFETVLPIQDRINKTIFDRLVTEEFQSFRQRYIIGWTPEVDEDTGMPKADAMRAMHQSMAWTFEADPADIKIGEFDQADFAAFIKATEADVNAMAAISKTPPHYLLGAMVNISGDALAAAESGLSAKTRKHARNFGACWERVMRYALDAAGSPLAADVAAEIIWGDIEHRTWGEQVDAVMKMGAEPIGVPREALWERLPYASPQDVARWRAMRAMQQLTDPVIAAPVAGDEPQSGDDDGTG